MYFDPYFSSEIGQNGHLLCALLGVCRSQRSLFEPTFLSQEKILSQGYIFLPKSLAKGIFWRNPLKMAFWG